MLAEATLLVALSVQHGSGAEACLDAARLKRGVEKRLKRRVFVEPARADLRFVVTFEKRGAELAARIELSSIDGTPRGTRTLVTGGHCSTLDDSLALSVALLVDQPPEPEPPAPAPPTESPASGALVAPVPAPVTKPKPAPTPITLPPDVAAPREPLHVRVGVAGAAGWGMLPGIRPALTLLVKLLPTQFYPVTLQGEAFWPADGERDAASGARFHLYRAALALCPPLSGRPEQGLSACVGQKLGFVEANGYGFDHDRRERRLTYALTLGGEARLQLLAPVSLRGYLGGEVPVVRDRFTSGGRNASNLFQPSPVAVTAEIGLEAQLW